MSTTSNTAETSETVGQAINDIINAIARLRLANPDADTQPLKTSHYERPDPLQLRREGIEKRRQQVANAVNGAQGNRLFCVEK